jgi:hypothetical protein
MVTRVCGSALPQAARMSSTLESNTNERVKRVSGFISEGIEATGISTGLLWVFE